MAEVAPALLVVTLGAAGALAWHGPSRLSIPAAPVAPLADTVGAGDTFMAGLLAGLHDADALSPAALADLTATR
jgi:fructokinase